MAARDTAAWRRWFTQNGIDALPLRYEDLVEDMDGATRGVLSFLEIPVPPGLTVSARTEMSADARNGEWVARYLALRP